MKAGEIRIQGEFTLFRQAFFYFGLNVVKIYIALN